MLATAVNRNNSSTLPDALGTLSLYSPTTPCQESRKNDAWIKQRVSRPLPQHQSMQGRGCDPKLWPQFCFPERETHKKMKEG